VGVLTFAWASEALGGVAAITGAFVAGVALAASPLKHQIERGMHTLTYAFFVPIFLVGIGLTADARALSSSDLWLALVISLVAILSKVIGAGTGARLGGMNWREALRVGVGMASRGEVGLIVAAVGVATNVISANVFIVAVVMVLVTTLATPPLLRLAFRQQGGAHGANGDSGN
jgi:Kef-type K+ transport system membrane component KefB